MKPKYATLNKFHDQLVTVMLLEWCPENLPRNLPPGCIIFMFVDITRASLNLAKFLLLLQK